tara:strand:- start:2010 stop:2309 length:300 start_codon:yes stop_codon:yes gene_type:complete
MKQYIFDQFVDNILKHTGYSKEQLFAPSRKSEVADARRVLYKLCKDRGFANKVTESYMKENGFVCFPNTIPQALASLDKAMANDPDYQVIINKLSNVDA